MSTRRRIEVNVCRQLWPDQHGRQRVAGSLIINSAYWQALSGDSSAALGATPSYPQDELADDQTPGQQRFLVDYAQGKNRRAVPYTTGLSTQTPSRCWLYGNNGDLDTVEFTVPPSGSSAAITSPHDPTMRQRLPARLCCVLQRRLV